MHTHLLFASMDSASPRDTLWALVCKLVQQIDRQIEQASTEVLQALRADLRELQRVNLVAAALRRSADVALPAFGPSLK